MTRKKGNTKNSNGKIKKLELLLEFSKRSLSEKNLESLLILLADASKTLLNADRCTIFILDKKRDVLWSKFAHGTNITLEIPCNRGFAGEAIRTGKSLNIRNAYLDKRFYREIDVQTGFKTRSILTVPMKNLKGNVLGVFQVLNRKSSIGFTGQDEELLNMLTGQAAVAIENANLYRQIKEAAREMIMRLSAAAEYKDMDTGRHIARMSRYSALIAEKLGYSHEFCENILLASSMHDIGKVGVPDAILAKPGSLSHSEWKEMRNHTIYGGEILKGSESELIKMSCKIALSHHEKFDGSGYPHGLKGGEIPIEGRIIALADVFDALTSKRSYKDKFSMEETLKIIRGGIGKHFDPKVVQAFEKAFPKILDVMEKYSEKLNHAHL